MSDEMSDDKPDELVRLNVAAIELGVVSKTVKKYCRCRFLKCRRLPSGQWRVYRSSLDQAVSKQAQTYPK